MEKYYDYVIVGGGPTGLTLALYLSKYQQRVALLEKEDSLGGCHAVKRVDGLFTEHGPRVYLDNYLTFQQLLQEELGTSYQELFTPYHYGNADFAATLFRTLTMREMVVFATALLTLQESDKQRTFASFLEEHRFSEKAQDVLDRIGRLTDGGGIAQYTLFSFLQIVNQNLLYPRVYEPRRPNDVALFSLWRAVLEKRGVAVFLNTEVSEFQVTPHDPAEGETVGAKLEWVSVTPGQGTGSLPMRFYANRFVFAMPPLQIRQLFHKNHLKTGFLEDFDAWATATNYIPYIPVVFHWERRVPVKRAWGYPQTAWGVGYIVMSDYMDFADDRSRTVISSLITMPDAPSDVLRKTANQVGNREELIAEVFRQLKTMLGSDLPDYDTALVSQNTYDGEKWVPLHTAFMTTTHGYLPFRSLLYSNVYNCGVQNGKSEYVFTSMESSVVNALQLVKEMVPKSRNDINIRTPWTFRECLGWGLVLVLMLVWLVVLWQSGGKWGSLGSRSSRHRG